LGQLAGLFSQGPEWKLVRSFLQTDLFSPKSAKRYVPSIIEAADNCSKAAGHYQNDLKEFLDYASFEMFYSIMFGSQLHIVDPTKERDSAALTFAQTVGKALSVSQACNRNMAAYTLKTALNYENAIYSEAKGYWKTSMEIANSIVDDFVARRDRGELTEGEKDSYLNQALIRQSEQDQEKGGLTFDEVKMSCAGLLSAGVDTTSGMMSWFVLHVAMNPNVQQRLREELQATLVNGKLTADSLSSSTTPYLFAVTRESHRLTSPIPTHVFRIIPENFEVHGRSFPEKTVICFDGYSKGVDPEIVDDPLTFNPDRWMPEGVEARKGTPSEVIDHPLFSLPFGQGARRCPGSRVARNEGHIMLAQLVLDWEMTTPSVKHWKDVPYGQATLTVPMPMPRIEMTPLFK
jgi:cytochrome P450